MNQEEMAELVAENRFSPFVIVMTDGYALAIGPEERKHLVVGRTMLVTLDQLGDIVHIPYRSIAHINEPKN
jgi:hypothetical protein